MKTALLPIAEGFEEIEAVTICDVLRRAGIKVTMAGLGGRMITGAHAITIQTDTDLETVQDEQFDAIILPGGMGGTKNLLASAIIKAMLQHHAHDGKIISAICAAPWVLAEADLLTKKQATIYPSLEDKIGGTAAPQTVVQDGNIITSKGPATAMEFALLLVKELTDGPKATEVAQGLLFSA